MEKGLRVYVDDGDVFGYGTIVDLNAYDDAGFDHDPIAVRLECNGRRVIVDSESICLAADREYAPAR